MAVLFRIPRQFLDANGNPLASGSIRVDLTGTTTLASLYSDVGLSVALSNPSTLDASGYAPPIFAAAAAYKVRVFDSNGVQQFSADPVAALGTAADVAQLQTDVNTAESAIDTLEAFNVVHDYVPTFNGTVGNATRTGKYVQIGKLVFYQLTFTYGSTSVSPGGGAALEFGLPVAPLGSGMSAGTAVILDSGTGFYTALAYTSGTAVQLFNCDGFQSGNIIGSAPATWTTNDSFTISGVYLAA